MPICDSRRLDLVDDLVAEVPCPAEIVAAVAELSGDTTLDANELYRGIVDRDCTVLPDGRSDVDGHTAIDERSHADKCFVDCRPSGGKIAW